MLCQIFTESLMTLDQETNRLHCREELGVLVVMATLSSLTAAEVVVPLAKAGAGASSLLLEFKSPVASGFLTCFGSNWTATGLSNITLCVDQTETCGNRLPSVAMAITTGRDQFFTRPVLMLTMLHVL